MLRKLILTVALAALYQGEPAQLAGSLLTVFIFLVLHMLLGPYLNQGLNIFQRLALISQFFTVFGGLMFVLTDLMELQGSSDGNGKVVMSWLVMMINLVASCMYPVYRFFTAWSESGEIDMKSISSSIKEIAEACLPKELIDSLVGTCSCLGKIKDLGDTEIVKMVEDVYAEVATLKEEVLDEVVDTAGELQGGAQELRREMKRGLRNRAEGDEEVQEEEEDEEESGEDEIEEEENGSKLFNDMLVFGIGAAGVLAATTAAYVSQQPTTRKHKPRKPKLAQAEPIDNAAPLDVPHIEDFIEYSNIPPPGSASFLPVYMGSKLKSDLVYHENTPDTTAASAGSRKPESVTRKKRVVV